MVIVNEYQMNKRYYKKKGPSYKERLRCPLCGKLSPIRNFSQDHYFGIFRCWFKGKGNISWEYSNKEPNFMKVLVSDIVKRLLSLIKEFTGEHYYSQTEVNKMLLEHGIIKSVKLNIVPDTIRLYPDIRIVPNKVVIK
jgi:hypothetical protein